MLAALQDHTHYRATADSALLKWIIRHAARLVPRFRSDVTHPPFHRAVGDHSVGKLLKIGEFVVVHLPEVDKAPGNPA